MKLYSLNELKELARRNDAFTGVDDEDKVAAEATWHCVKPAAERERCVGILLAV